MIGITERIKAILTEYAEKYNSAATERDRLKADNSAKYLPQVASVENEKVDEAFNESIAPLKEKALADVGEVIKTASVYIRIRVQDINTEMLAEINALKGVDLSDYEIKALRVKYRGTYWPLKVLWEMFGNKTGDAVGENMNSVNSFKPEPEKYFAIFGEIMQEVKKFIECYAGSAALTSTDANAVHSHLLLTGNYFNEIEDKINYNPDFFVSFAPWHGLTPEEREKIKKEEERNKLIDKARAEQAEAQRKQKEIEEWEKKYSLFK